MNHLPSLRTKDAFRPGEFTATIRTEQYRDLLRAEKNIMEKHRDVDKEQATAQVRRPPLLRQEKCTFDAGVGAQCATATIGSKIHVRGGIVERSDKLQTVGTIFHTYENFANEHLV